MFSSNSHFTDSSICMYTVICSSWSMTRRCFSTLQRCAISGKMESTEISSMDVAAFQTQPLLPIGCCGYKYHCKGSAVQASRCLANMIGSLREINSASLRSCTPSPSSLTKINRASQDLGHMGLSRRVSAW
jgi:hypothetical protein